MSVVEEAPSRAPTAAARSAATLAARGPLWRMAISKQLLRLRGM